MEKNVIEAEPYFDAAAERIKDLAKTIHENVVFEELENVMLWAQEIVEQCKIIYTMRGNANNNYVGICISRSRQ